MTPFEDDLNDDIKLEKKQIGLKINNDKSSVNKESENIRKSKIKEEFEKKANIANSTYNSYNERAADIAFKFKKLIDDTTLPENKNMFSSSVESEFFSDFFKLGMEMDEDELQPTSAGSMGLLVLVSKIILMQRDKINKLSYNYEALEKKIKSLENKKDANIIDSKK